MLLDRWRARRAIRTRTPPTPISDHPDPALFEVVEGLRERFGKLHSLGDPLWHFRWEGELQLVGLDVSDRSSADARQRLTRLVHELTLRHMGRGARRVLAVLLVRPEAGEGLRPWYTRLMHDEGEVGRGDWSAARRHLAVLMVDREGHHELFGADRAIEECVNRWFQERNQG